MYKKLYVKHKYIFGYNNQNIRGGKILGFFTLPR